MSAPDILSLSVSAQESIISASLITEMLFNFLMGIYTVLYAGTMYMYGKSASTGRQVVLCTISVLYLLCMTQFILQWYYLDLAVVIDGDTRASIFISTLEGGPTILYAFFEFCFYSALAVSDGLLIWRCYHVWGMSLRVIIVPLILLLAEVGVIFALTIMSALHNAVQSTTVAAVETALTLLQVYSSLVTTIMATILIGYKIHSSCRPTSASSKRQFIHVAKIVFESATVYSIAILVYAIVEGLPEGRIIGSPFYIVDYYLQIWVVIAAGMAPTVLVARISYTNASSTASDTIPHLSGFPTVEWP